MNLLTLTFSASFCRGWPKLKFYLDDELYQELNIESETATAKIPVELTAGKHRLIIKMWGKTKFNTVLKDSVIISDQVVTLDSMYIDDIQLPDFFKYCGTFTNDYDSTSPCLTWGYNGEWTWDFKAPIITWILTEISKEEKKYFSEQQLGDDSGNEELSFEEINKIIKKINY